MTAHGSMPEKGRQRHLQGGARGDGARAVRLQLARPVLGAPTLNVGTIPGGLNINSVPDRAMIGIDIRTIPAQGTRKAANSLTSYLGEDVSWQRGSTSRASGRTRAIRGCSEVFQSRRRRRRRHRRSPPRRTSPMRPR